MAAGGLVDHLDIKRGGLVVHCRGAIDIEKPRPGQQKAAAGSGERLTAPATVYEFKPAFRDQRARQVLLGSRLHVPPARKEANLDVDEAPRRVLRQPWNDGVEHVVDVGEKILVDGDLPAGIVMGMRHKVHIDLALDDGRWRADGGVIPIDRHWVCVRYPQQQVKHA
jgi:hypothetical protein